MAKFDVINTDRQKVSEIELSDAVFAAEANENLVWEVAKFQAITRRAGTVAVKNTSLVSGGGKKPWKQKHTGRARQGSTRASHWRKGAVIFGPQPRDWSYNIPKKVRRQALKSALSLKHRDGNILVLRDFNLAQVKTKQVVNFLKRFELDRVLILINEDNEILKKSARNLEEVKVLKADGLNVYDLLRFNSLVMTEDSLSRVQEVLKN